MKKLLYASEAMLCWNSETKHIGVMRHPANPHEWDQNDYRADVGAKFNAFRNWIPQAQALALITEGIWLIRNEGFNPEKVFSALEQIEECAAAMTQDPFTNGYSDRLKLNRKTL